MFLAAEYSLFSALFSRRCASAQAGRLNLGIARAVCQGRHWRTLIYTDAGLE